jgi:hypothetical protein
MASILPGLWSDYTQPGINSATITLTVDLGNLVLSALTFLVTLAGASFWNLTAFGLHSLAVKGDRSNALHLQHQVALRNSGSSIGTLWEALKIYSAWRVSKPPKLFLSTLGLAGPALLVWVGFAFASIFTSRVANKSYGPAIARVRPGNCGFLQYNLSTSDAVSPYTTMSMNTTIQARDYVSNFYANTSTASKPTTYSTFPQTTLPYMVNTSAPCPIPGLIGALEMATPYLDSATTLGINARQEDRVEFQMKTTCSPVDVADLSSTTAIGNHTFQQVHVGPKPDVKTNATYIYNTESQFTDLSYMVQSVYFSWAVSRTLNHC